MLKTRADLIEELIGHDQSTCFAHGDEPRLEMRQKPLLHHFSSSFSVWNPEQAGGRGTAPFAVLVENISVPSQVR
jgi:hypothetical protein